MRRGGRIKEKEGINEGEVVIDRKGERLHNENVGERREKVSEREGGKTIAEMQH